FERNMVLQIACRTLAVRPRDQDDHQDDAHPEGENSAKRQKTLEYEAYVSGESLSRQVFQEEQAPSTLDDDEIPMKQVSQDIIKEVSLIIDEAKLRKMADEMLRQRCTLADEHQYHIDQMKNFLKNDIVWESRKEILVSPHLRKTTPLVYSCQKDPEALTLSLINQDLLYLKKGNSGPEKIVLSLHKFPAVIFNDDDIEERTSRWVNKCVRKFNPYARYGVEHWKNPHAKIFYIRKQKEPRKPKEEVYSNSKIIQVVKTYWELGHEHKFITEIVARRANKYLVSITEPDYKNLNKNDIEDIYLLIMNGKVPDYADTGLLWSLSVFIRSTVIWERVHDFQLGIESYQQKVNLTAPTMTFPGIEDHEMFSIIYEPVHGIIYKNSKKEKRVMRHSEIHKFCDATLNRVLEGLKSYNNDIKYGYVQKDLTKDEAEYLKLFEEEIEERLKHQRQMRRWEIVYCCMDSDNLTASRNGEKNYIIALALRVESCDKDSGRSELAVSGILVARVFGEMDMFKREKKRFRDLESDIELLKSAPREGLEMPKIFSDTGRMYRRSGEVCEVVEHCVSLYVVVSVLRLPYESVYSRRCVFRIDVLEELGVSILSYGVYYCVDSGGFETEQDYLVRESDVTVVQVSLFVWWSGLGTEL
ncbi:hypothetical protein Tco_0695070, partial [Tanacetum coccineum]